MNKKRKLTLSFLFAGIFLLIGFAHAFEDNKPAAVYGNDKIQKILIEKEIENILKEKNYTRVPNKDFDEYLDNKVSSKINDKFTNWATVIGIFITVIAGLAAYTFNNKIKQLVLEQVRNQTEKEMQGIKKYMLDSRKYTLRSDLEGIKKRFEQDPLSEANIIETKSLLNEIKELGNQKLLSEIVDQLALMYFKKRTPKEIEELIDGNESKCEILETTYMNAAILYSDLYELDGSKWYKENCLKYCTLAAKKVPHYGEPQGITLIIHGIDYLNSSDEKDKESAINSAKELINEILRGSSSFTAYNTVKRIEKDKLHEIFKKYIVKLEEVIPIEFTNLYDKAKEYSKESGAQN
ncbi:MAG: hypothetical protein HY096_15475 [Nitrospinae bacterium]|nr:hypothetical protein [Nitrospinota bacterium]